MTPRANYCSCPHCQTIQAVPTHLLGQTVPCAVCRTPFHVPLAASGNAIVPPATPSVHSPNVPPIAPPMTPPVAPPIAQTIMPAIAPPLGPMVPPPGSLPLAGSPGGYPLAPPVATPIAPPIAPPVAPPLAPPVEASLAAPLAAASSTADGVAGDESTGEVERPRRGWVWELAFLLTFLSLMVGGLTVAISVVQRRKQAKLAAQAEEAEEMIRELKAEDELQETPHWSDASRFTLQKEAMKVRVREVVWGPVRTRDSGRRVMADDQSEFLCVYVSLRNSRDEVRYYRSWYGGKFNVSGAPKTVVLTDNADRSYPVHRFTAVSAIQGHVPVAELRRPEETKDLIVFDLPERLDRGSVQWLRLELPAAAYGGEGFLRFEIPVSMIQNWGPQSGGMSAGLGGALSEGASGDGG